MTVCLMRNTSVCLKFDSGWSEGDLKPLNPELWRQIATWIGAENVVVLVQKGLEQSTLKIAFNSPQFARAYFKDRNRCPTADVVVPIVTRRESCQALAYGRAYDWRDGIASQILKGYLQSRIVVFRHGSMGKPAQGIAPLLIADEYPTSAPCTSRKRSPRKPSREPIPGLPDLSSCLGDEFSSLSAELYAARPKRAPKTPHLPITSACRYGYHGDQGPRPHMEDMFLVDLELNYLKPTLESYVDFRELATTFEPNWALTVEGQKSSETYSSRDHMYFGLFDGHNGREAAIFVRDYLHVCIVRHPQFPLNLQSAIHDSFVQVDKEFLRLSKAENWESGTTALSLILSGDRLVIAHAGDCRAVICRGGKGIPLTRDHHPDCVEEKKRVERAGGFVRDGRVGDLLSVARAFGDYDVEKGMKILGLSCHPEISDVLLEDNDEFIILASDGLWEKFSVRNAISYARRSLSRHGDVRRTCEELVREALRRGSTDNVSVMVISFHEREGFSWEATEKETQSDPSGTKFTGQRPRFCFDGFKALQDALAEATGPGESR